MLRMRRQRSAAACVGRSAIPGCRVYDRIPASLASIGSTVPVRTQYANVDVEGSAYTRYASNYTRAYVVHRTRPCQCRENLRHHHHGFKDQGNFCPHSLRRWSEWGTGQDDDLGDTCPASSVPDVHATEISVKSSDLLSEAAASDTGCRHRWLRGGRARLLYALVKALCNSRGSFCVPEYGFTVVPGLSGADRDTQREHRRRNGAGNAPCDRY